MQDMFLAMNLSCCLLEEVEDMHEKVGWIIWSDCQKKKITQNFHDKGLIYWCQVIFRSMLVYHFPTIFI